MQILSFAFFILYIRGMKKKTNRFKNLEFVALLTAVSACALIVLLILFLTLIF